MGETYSQEFRWSMDENGFRRGKCIEIANGITVRSVDTLDENEFLRALDEMLSMDEEDIRQLTDEEEDE